MKLRLLLAAAALLPACDALAQRQTVGLPTGWKFIRREVAADAPASDEWKPVAIPHCWNALDGQVGAKLHPELPEGYYRGPAWYERALEIPADWKGRRVFVRFEAAFLVADVYVNGQHLGQHRGGFTAFVYELTPHLKLGGANVLRVRVNNARDAGVAPLQADFTMEGGIYRPVSLLVTDAACITPLDAGGPGLYATALNVSGSGAQVQVETKLDGAGDPLQVTTEIKDAEGKIVEQQTAPAAGSSVKQTFRMERPHLWNGRKDPYLYTITARLQREGKTIDEVTQPLGLRTVAITREDGFLLNGQAYPIHGVNRHQEKRDQGWALSAADHEADLQTILDVGATAVRLAHYPQSGTVHDFADRNGLLLWQEIPIVDGIADSPAFTDNARQQLTEMIRQGCNHPSLFTWGLFNELYNMKETPPPEPLIGALDQLARELDPSRPTTAASNRLEKKALDTITGWIGFNIYPGWYSTGFDGFADSLRQGADMAGQRIAISEYGAGANPGMHQEGALTQPLPDGPFHPEEWQSHVHETAWSLVRNDKNLWGTFVWTMFDFASGWRDEGGNPGVNDKGLVTEDRKLKKDAYFFYKANWNPEPMVYLTGRRLTPRRLARTEIKAYSNCESASLKVNGRVIGSVAPDEVRICRWPEVELQPGVNKIEVSASGNLSDRCEWTLLAPAEPAPTPSL